MKNFRNIDEELERCRRGRDAMIAENERLIRERDEARAKAIDEAVELVEDFDIDWAKDIEGNRQLIADAILALRDSHD